MDFKSEKEFLDYIIEHFLICIHKRIPDNYEPLRFSTATADRSKNFFLEQHKAYFTFFIDNYRDFYKAYLLIADEESRKKYLSLILFNLAGHLHVKLFTNTDNYWKQRNEGLKKTNKKSELRYKPLIHFDKIPFEGQFIDYDGNFFHYLLTYLQRCYYFQSDNITIKPERGDYVIDAGACFGDTTLAFAVSAGEEGKVFAFDLIDSHVEVIRHNAGQNPELTDRIKIFNCALGDTVNDDSKPVNLNEYTFHNFSLVDKDASNIAMQTIDNLVDRKEIPRVDFIKMDIEGYELKALQGAQESIKTFKPKLAISLYHKPEDFFEIPLFINNLNLGYRFYIDHYTIYNEETVLYASAG